MIKPRNPKPAPEPANPTATWRTLVRNALRSLGGTASLADLYRTLELHPKTKANRNFKAKIRQQLRLDPHVEQVSMGVWRLKPEGR